MYGMVVFPVLICKHSLHQTPLLFILNIWMQLIQTGSVGLLYFKENGKRLEICLWNCH